MENRIAELVLKKYNELGKNGKPRQNEWTLLAGFVISSSNNDLNLVSLATGTKCIGKSKMSMTGSVLNDCHAEVLARRGLLRYLYECMHSSITGDASSSVLEYSESSGKFRLKEGVGVHLYCSHVPCGDASIIPMLKRKSDCHSLESCVKKIKTTFESDSQVSIGPIVEKESDSSVYDDVYRTGGKCMSGEDPHGPGKFYHTVGLVRTKPGRGEPTLSLSCSDKIAKWIYCGLQGGLLSLLIDDAVRLKSITVGGGGQFCPEAMKRALLDRCTTPAELHPLIKQSSLVFDKSRYSTPDANPCATSIIWSFVKNKSLEVSVDGRRLGVTKKSSEASGRLQISRMELFVNLIKLSGDKYKGMNYRQVRAQAANYYNRFEEFKMRMGCWSDKPLSFLDFLPDVPT